MATKSMCETFICVKNMAEAEYLADFMLNGGDEEEFLKRCAALACVNEWAGHFVCACLTLGLGPVGTGCGRGSVCVYLIWE